MELTINPKFVEEIPSLSEQEFRQLEENILADGRVITPIIVWKQPESGMNVIVDGHNRYRIIQLHPELPYEIFEKEFPDEYAALAFIYKNQLGRRNLTPQQRKYLIGKQYSAEKASRGGERGAVHDEKTGKFTSNGQNVHLRLEESPRERIARENNTNERFVRRAGFYADGVDAAEEAEPGIRQDILSGVIHPTDQAVTAVAKSPPQERAWLVQQLREEPVTKVSQKQILDIYDSMVHSEGITTEDDVILDMQDAVDTLIFRWNKCLELNPDIAKEKTFGSRVRKIAQEAILFLHKF